MSITWNISSRFSNNSVANASELLEELLYVNSYNKLIDCKEIPWFKYGIIDDTILNSLPKLKTFSTVLNTYLKKCTFIGKKMTYDIIQSLLPIWSECLRLLTRFTEVFSHLKRFTIPFARQ